VAEQHLPQVAACLAARLELNSNLYLVEILAPRQQQALARASQLHRQVVASLASLAVQPAARPNRVSLGSKQAHLECRLKQICSLTWPSPRCNHKTCQCLCRLSVNGSRRMLGNHSMKYQLRNLAAYKSNILFIL